MSTGRYLLHWRVRENNYLKFKGITLVKENNYEDQMEKTILKLLKMLM